jgi:hypothetical protein
MPKVLDLRNKPKATATKESVNVPIKKEPAQVKSYNINQVQPQISWEAPSFYFNPQKRYLSLLVGALALGGAGMLFFNRDTLTAIFLLLSSLVLMLYSGKRPEISRIRIDQTGITVGNNMYQYKDLKSFWIHYDPGNMKELSLESRKWYIPYVKVSIENKNPLVIRSLLVNFLAEKEHEHSLIDIISRKIGL